MDRYTFIDSQSGRTVVATVEGVTPEGWPGWTLGVRDTVAARELLRLAQREADLMRAEGDTRARLRAVNFIAEERKQRIAALERENREKTLELAEKAGRIRELEHARDCEVAAGQRAASRLVAMETAIEDGIAHVERARGDLLKIWDPTIPAEKAPLSRDVIEQLGLAHEALGAAVRVEVAEKSLAFLTRREPDVEDRLKLGEGRAEGLDLRVRDLHNRIAALEAGKE